MNDRAPSLFSSVRESCKAVADAARLVSINHEAIESYAATIPVQEAKAAAAADRVGSDVAPSDPAATIAHVLATAGVSFTSGWHDIMRKRPGLSGAVSTIARLDDYVQATGALTPDRLCAITRTDASQIFEQELDGGALEQLVVMLATTLNELGELANDYDGFVSLVNHADHSAERLASALGKMPSWHDVAAYHHLTGAIQPTTTTVWFFKRAQMAVASLHRSFAGRGVGRFDDLDQLTIFADNLVPHVLRVDGLLDYDPGLLLTIEKGGLLPAGSAAEVEIRACGVHVAELIAAAIRANDSTGTESLTLADLDHWLWSRGGAARYKAAPRHRCRNPFY